MIRFIYNFLLLLLSPFWFLWMISRTRKRQGDPNWAERWGEFQITPRDDRKRILIHAVSVGEVQAAKPILEELRKLLPDWEIILTTTTSTGHAIANDYLTRLIDGLFYYPIDLPNTCLKVLLRVRPCVVAIMETELWMNLLHASKKVGAATLLINGRISDRSFKRSKWLRFFYKDLLKRVDFCLMQTNEDAKRMQELGGQNCEVLGNTKYDATIEEGAPIKITKKNDERIIVVGSTRGEFEEDFVLKALKGTSARVIFAPRHIERSKQIMEKARSDGHDCSLRSEKGFDTRFTILDTYGELSSLYDFADVAIIGGGFDNLGGQNIIQPMSASCPVICGKNMQNFREPFEEGVKAGAIKTAETSDELKAILCEVLENSELKFRMGQAGHSLVQKHLGAAKRYADRIANAAISAISS